MAAPWCPMVLHGTPWGAHGCAWGSMEPHEAHGSLWDPLNPLGKHFKPHTNPTNGTSVFLGLLFNQRERESFKM